MTGSEVSSRARMYERRLPVSFPPFPRTGVLLSSCLPSSQPVLFPLFAASSSESSTFLGTFSIDPFRSLSCQLAARELPRVATPLGQRERRARKALPVDGVVPPLSYDGSTSLCAFEILRAIPASGFTGGRWRRFSRCGRASRG